MNLPLIFQYSSAAICAIFAIGVVLQGQRSISRWAFAFGMIAFATESLLSSFSLLASSIETSYRWQSLKLVAIASIPGPWLLFSLTYARGNAKDFLKKWWLPLTSSFFVPLILALVYQRHLFVLVPSQDLKEIYTIRISWPGSMIHVVLLLGMIASMMSLERTFRAAVGTMRWRIKFMMIGLGTLFLARLYSSSQILLFGTVEPTLDTLNAGALIISCLIALRSLLRSGHFEIEVYPSRAVIQNSITVLLAGIYLFAIGVLAKFASLIGGGNAFPAKALGILLSLVLLAILLQSDRFRLYTKQFISRHFQRPLYDYRTIWRRFTEETSTQMDQRLLSQSVSKLVADIFSTLSVTIWLIDDDLQSLRLSASTSIPNQTLDDRFESKERLTEMVRFFQNNPEPVDIDQTKEPWMVALKKANPREFAHGGHRICVPLTAKNTVVGIMILGDRVGGMKFTIQEYDMLKSVGNHAASNLLNLQLSQKVLETKELEAFQTMATFFVHDLKNAASTLNIMVKNLPIHWDNPEFRKDALRGITKTGGQINNLITKLGTIRHELKIETIASDLNAVLEKVINDCAVPQTVSLCSGFGKIPEVQLDTTQLKKVFLNLIMNAIEAMPNGGTVKVLTEKEDNWAIVSVEDNGCGISREFLEKSLFRPFKTTKQKGLGIGMFQSKMIVEAHGGRFEVESAQGEGSTFKVILPI